MENPQASMGLASELFTDMVMQEAIKDKTDMVQKQMEADAGIGAYTINAGNEEKKDHDSDLDDFDEDEEKIMRSMAEARMAAMKEEF